MLNEIYILISQCLGMDILIFIFQVLILFCVGYLAISNFINGNDTFHTNKILNNLNDLQNRLIYIIFSFRAVRLNFF